MSSSKWREYYRDGGASAMGGSGRYVERRGKHWTVSFMGYVSDNLPAFTDIFDEHTFYWFAFFFTCSTFLMAFLLAKVFKLRVNVRE